MMLRPDLFFTLLMAAEDGAEPPGDASPGGSAAPAEGGPKPSGSGEIDWRARYEALEADRRKDRTRLDELEGWKKGADESAAGDDVKAQLELRDKRIAELEGTVNKGAAERREREFMTAATRGVPEAKRAVVELAIRGTLAKSPELGEGDPEVAADKLRRSLEAQGLGGLFSTDGTGSSSNEGEGATSSSSATKPTPPTTKPATTGRRDWSAVKSIEELDPKDYGQIPDSHWRRLTDQ